MNNFIYDTIQVMEDMVKFPGAQVCRHYVACSLFSLLEKNGVKMPPELAKSLVESSTGDEESLRLIENLKNEHKIN